MSQSEKLQRVKRKVMRARQAFLFFKRVVPLHPAAYDMQKGSDNASLVAVSNQPQSRDNIQATVVSHPFF